MLKNSTPSRRMLKNLPFQDPRSPGPNTFTGLHEPKLKRNFFNILFAYCLRFNLLVNLNLFIQAWVYGPFSSSTTAEPVVTTSPASGGGMDRLEAGAVLPMVTFGPGPPKPPRQRSSSRRRRRTAPSLETGTGGSRDGSWSSVDLDASGGSSPIYETAV
jgi:hypothetical protein